MEQVNRFWNDPSGLAGSKPAWPGERREGLLCYELKARVGADTRERIGAELAGAMERFGPGVFTRAEPEILVARFYAPAEMEATLLRWLNRVAGQQEGFSVVLNNYGSMPGYPLYLRIQDPAPFRRFVTSLQVIDAWLRGNDCPPMQFFQQPRLLLVESLQPGMERSFLLDFSARSFRADLELEELVLTSRVPGQEKPRWVSLLKMLPPGLRRRYPDEVE